MCQGGKRRVYIRRMDQALLPASPHPGIPVPRSDDVNDRIYLLLSDICGPLVFPHSLTEQCTYYGGGVLGIDTRGTRSTWLLF